jgi:hypothetical protein
MSCFALDLITPVRSDISLRMNRSSGSFRHVSVCLQVYWEWLGTSKYWYANKAHTTFRWLMLYWQIRNKNLVILSNGVSWQPGKQLRPSQVHVYHALHVWLYNYYEERKMEESLRLICTHRNYRSLQNGVIASFSGLRGWPVIQSGVSSIPSTI